METSVNRTKYKFPFEQHPAKKGTCPKCDKKKSFRYFAGIDREYGICDRVNKCGHQNIPKDELRRQNEFTSIPLPKVSIAYPNQELCKSIIENQTSNFHLFLINNLKISPDHLNKWNCGTDKNNTCFIYKNQKQQFLNIVNIEYNKNCKRNKEKSPFSLTAPKGRKYNLCLFGESLLSQDKTICLIESEKIAVISSFFYPQFDWLATGGANKLTDEKISVLYNRKIYYLNDADKAGRENSNIKKLLAYKLDFIIIDLFPSRNDGYDLADAIIDGIKPEIKPKEGIKLKESRNVIKLNKYESIEKFGYFEKDFKYFVETKAERGTKELRVSNFTKEMLYTFQDGSNNVPHLFKLTKDTGEVALLEITSKDLFNLNSYCAAILGLGGFNYNGNTYTLKNIVENLYESCKNATYINTLGQNLMRDFYSFHKGILTDKGEYLECNEYGIVEIENEYYYIPSGSKQNENNIEFTDDKKFKFIPGKLTLKDFTEKINQIYGIDGIIGLCYTIATIHRDVIFRETNFFPFLFLYGPKGSGKSTYINFFMSFFGESQPEITSTSTQKAIERKLAQTNNNIQYVKEFSASFEGVLKDILKNAYDGVGYSRAQTSQNNRTKTSIIQAGLVLDGNYFPTTDGALFSRLLFRVWKPVFTDQTKMKIQKLQDLIKEGMGLIFSEIYIKRNIFKASFSDTYRDTLIEIKAVSKRKDYYFSERELSHISLIASVFKLSLSVVLDKNYYNHFINSLLESSLHQAQINESIDEVTKFFEALEVLDGSMVNRGYQYIRENKGSFDFLFIDYNACQTEYSESLRRSGEKKTIGKQELKQMLEFVVSTKYEYNEVRARNELYFPKKINGKTVRVLVFEVLPNTFELIK